MKFLIELDKSKNNVTEIYRKVLSKKAQAVQIVDDKENVVTIELWFADKDFFETMVNLVVDIDFSKVVMINNGDEEPAKTSNEEDEVLVENKPPEATGKTVEGAAGGEDVPKAAGPPVEKEPPAGGDVLKAEGVPVEGEVLDGGNVPKAAAPIEGEALTGDEIIKAAGVVAESDPPVSGEVLKTGRSDEKKGGDEGKDKKPKSPKKGTGTGTGKGSRKREGRELTDLLEIPDFPTEFILDKVMDFFRPMKDTVVDPLRTVLMIALDQNKDCTMEWKDLVAAASEMGVHLSDFDKVKYSKQIADVFEQHGYSVRAKGFLKLLRSYVDGTIKVPVVKKAEEQKPPAPVPAPEPPKEEKKVSRFAMIPYHEGLEELFTRVWDEGRGLDEMMVELLAYMAGEDLSDDEVAYLTVCAERVAFDSLNDIYLDMDKSQTEVRMIQASLSEKLNGFIEANNFKAVKLYDFLDELREIFERDA